MKLISTIYKFSLILYNLLFLNDQGIENNLLRVCVIYLSYKYFK